MKTGIKGITSYEQNGVTKYYVNFSVDSRRFKKRGFKTLAAAQRYRILVLSVSEMIIRHAGRSNINILVFVTILLFCLIFWKLTKQKKQSRKLLRKVVIFEIYK